MSDSPPDSRCGYTFPEDQELRDQLPNTSCCWRAVAPAAETDRCLWHADSNNVLKTAEALQEARVPPNQNEQAKPDLQRRTRPVAELLDGSSVVGVEFDDPLSLPNVSLRQADLSQAVLREADLSQAVLREADLSQADLRGANLSQADLRGADFSETALHGADLSRAVLHGADLSRAVLHGADLSRAVLHGADLSQADLRRADLSQAAPHGADLSQAVLRRVDFSQADLRRGDLSQANLREADLSQADLPLANLSEAALHGADLSEATLHGADLSQVVLREADLSQAVLREADLSQAVLREADLSQAVLREADLSLATLSGANLFRADVRSLNIDDVDEVGVTSGTKISSRVPFRTGFRHRPLRSGPRLWDERAQGYERLRKVFQAKALDDHHRKCYSFQRRSRAKEVLRTGHVVHWLGNYLSRFFTGHGVFISRVLIWTTVMLVLPVYWYGSVEGWTGKSIQGGPLYYSVVTFVTSPPNPLPEVQGSLDVFLARIDRQSVSQAVVLIQTYVGTLLIILLGYVLGNRDPI